MLDDEVAALRAAAAAPAPAAAAIGAGSSSSSAAAACMLLQGRLQLVLALVRTLDRRGVGSDSQGGLIRLLLQEFLFPEAVQQLAAAAGRLDLQSCAAKIEPRCATPSCRKAALELLSELMGDSPSSLEEGVALLIDLHYQQQTLRGWNMSPRPLRAPGQYMGLKNGGATCYMNAVFQQLFMQPAIRAGVLGAAAVEPSEAPDSVFAQLQVRRLCLVWHFSGCWLLQLLLCDCAVAVEPSEAPDSVFAQLQVRLLCLVWHFTGCCGCCIV